MMIEYANDAKKHIAVIEAEIAPAVLGLIVFAQASWKDLEFVSLQTFPIALKVYAATKPKIAHIILDGINADFSSAKNATPLGKESTPAPLSAEVKDKNDGNIYGYFDLHEGQ
jgi:hypothetical protein